METHFEPHPKAISAGLVKQSAIALGFFDGVHLGHQVVIGSAKKEAERLSVPCGVVTFKDHPRTLTRGQSPLLLTVIEQRLELLAGLGVDFALVLSFTEELCKLSPREYVETILVGGLGARSISVGPNHHFGRDREGDANLLSKLGEEHDFVVHVAEMVEMSNIEVSSSVIRDLILSSKMEQAQRLLSRPYALLGQVVQGDKRGQSLGFPTANLELYQYQLVPRRGVYVGLARLGLKESGQIPCVINIGYRPTFKDGAKIEPAEGEHVNELLTVEAHLLDFNSDLYGRSIEISFLLHLRGEEKFSGPDALKKQINKDIEQARKYLKGYLETTKKKSEPKQRLHVL